MSAKMLAKRVARLEAMQPGAGSRSHLVFGATSAEVEAARAAKIAAGEGDEGDVWIMVRWVEPGERP